MQDLRTDNLKENVKEHVEEEEIKNFETEIKRKKSKDTRAITLVRFPRSFFNLIRDVLKENGLKKANDKHKNHTFEI